MSATTDSRSPKAGTSITESLQGSISESFSPSLYNAMSMEALSEHSLHRYMISKLPTSEERIAAQKRYDQVQDYYLALRSCTRPK